MKFTLIAFSLTLLLINLGFYKTIFYSNSSESALKKPDIQINAYDNELVSPIYQTRSLENNIAIKLSR